MPTSAVAPAPGGPRGDVDADAVAARALTAGGLDLTAGLAVIAPLSFGEAPPFKAA